MKSPILTAVGSPAVTISARDADALLQSGDGDAALLYIYLLRCGGAASAADAAAALHRSAHDIDSAAARLRQLQLLKDGAAPVSGPKPEPASELPEYTAQDVLSMDSREFKTLLSETQSTLGRTLNTVELKKLFALYNDLGYSTELILLLIQYCLDERKAKGASNQLGFGAIEKEAYFWFNHGGVRTYEQAEQWVAELNRRRGITEQIKTALGIGGRSLTKTENDYITGWIELGYSAEALAIAYDRTVTNTGKLAWKYMDRIVRSWHEKNLHTPQEIEAGDSRTVPARGPAAAPDSAPSREENDRALERLAVLMQEMQDDNHS